MRRREPATRPICESEWLGRIQELVEGGLSERALARIEELAPLAPVRWRQRPGKQASVAGADSAAPRRDPRLPEPGTVITRTHGGKEHKVKVLADGFEYRRKRHRSLSRVAREITGTRVERIRVLRPAGTCGTQWHAGISMTRANKNSTAPATGVTKRCVIYTRKSTTAGLEQDFNSLDAQREACEGYVRSQAPLGWELVGESYDDGGFTGANLDRPAFTRLFADMDAGRIDVIVVYKVDRLSRSLLDFARIMDRMNVAGVAFVSVTQNFSTADAMGRLTLNMLMSFAEFEREMIAERTRDKMAAARRRGKWTGGPVPLGYEIQDKRLVVNELEALVVREVFDIYVESRSALAVARELNERKRVTKRHRSANGRLREARRWDKASVLRVLKNALYAGYMTYGDERYEGEHVPIVERDVFDQVRALISANGNGCKRNGRNPDYLLAGILFCAQCGSAFTPASTRKGTREYRYYRCVTRDKQGKEACPSAQLPAAAIEDYVVEHLRDAVGDGSLVADVTESAKARVAQRRGDLATGRTHLPGEIAKLSAEGKRLVDKIGEIDGGGGRLLDERLQEVGAQLARSEARLVEVERDIAGLDPPVSGKMPPELSVPIRRIARGHNGAEGIRRG